jgi:hypothetical protein
MRARPLSELLRLPVRIGGIQLGRPVEAYADGAGRLIGFEVATRDGCRCFLPLAAADVRDDEIAVSSALVLDERLGSYYRQHGLRLAQLAFVEPWVDEDGNLHEPLSAA